MNDEVQHDHRLRALCNGCRAEVDALEQNGIDRYDALYRQSPSLPQGAAVDTAAPPVFGDSNESGSEYGGLKGRRPLLSPKAVLEAVAVIALVAAIAWRLAGR